MITHGLACWLVGRRIPILAIDLRCPQPDYIEDYRVMFSDNLRFSRPLSRLLFNADCLALPVRRDKRELRRFLLGAPANILVRYRDPQSLAARIKAYLRSLRPGRWPDADALAGHFFMAPSTLRRKLSLEGQSYQALKDQVRRDLAIAPAGRRRGEFRRTGAGAGLRRWQRVPQGVQEVDRLDPGQYRTQVAAETASAESSGVLSETLGHR